MTGGFPKGVGWVHESSSHAAQPSSQVTDCPTPLLHCIVWHAKAYGGLLFSLCYCHKHSPYRVMHILLDSPTVTLCMEPAGVCRHAQVWPREKPIGETTFASHVKASMRWVCCAG